MPATLASPLFIPHITVAGERWDNLAWQYYGDATLIAPIIFANPDVAIMAVFDPGIMVRIPILAYDAVQSTARLPPWRQGVNG